MRYPAFLKENDTIGFPAPSFGCASEPYKTGFRYALKRFQDMGYGVKPGPNAGVELGIGISNLPEKCGAEINDMFSDEEVSALISCGGGELMCEILEFVDFELLKKLPPKWFAGYSDNTNLTFLLATICDTASFYAPCAATYGMNQWHQSLQDFYDMLIGKNLRFSAYPKWEEEGLKDEEHPLLPYNCTEDRIHKLFVDGSFYADANQYPSSFDLEGRILGGCMDCLVNLLGTEFDHTVEFIEKYKEDGILWFLESCDLNVFSIRRAMWQMEKAGWFQYVKGFLIGRPANGAAIANLDCYEAILGVASKKKVPVIMDMDIGHRPPMLPIMVGSIAKVHISGNDLNIEFIQK